MPGWRGFCEEGDGGVGKIMGAADRKIKKPPSQIDLGGLFYCSGVDYGIIGLFLAGEAFLAAFFLGAAFFAAFLGAAFLAAFFTAFFAAFLGAAFLAAFLGAAFFAAFFAFAILFEFNS